MSGRRLDVQDPRTSQALEAALEVLRARGLRRTRGRRDVLHLLLGTPEHLTVTELHGRLDAYIPDASTTYRIVAVLVEHGVLHSVPTPRGVVYGLADPVHHHAICRRCEVITDLPAGRVGSAVELLAEAGGLGSGSVEVAVFGLCADCR